MGEHPPLQGGAGPPRVRHRPLRDADHAGHDGRPRHREAVQRPAVRARASSPSRSSSRPSPSTRRASARSSPRPTPTTSSTARSRRSDGRPRARPHRGMSRHRGHVDDDATARRATCRSTPTSTPTCRPTATSRSTSTRPQAVERGIAEIAITDHVDFEPGAPAFGYATFDDRERVVRDAAERWGRRRASRSGSASSSPTTGAGRPTSATTCARHAYDFAIGSVHVYRDSPYARRQRRARGSQRPVAGGDRRAVLRRGRGGRPVRPVRCDRPHRLRQALSRTRTSRRRTSRRPELYEPILRALVETARRSRSTPAACARPAGETVSLGRPIVGALPRARRAAVTVGLRRPPRRERSRGASTTAYRRSRSRPPGSRRLTFRRPVGTAVADVHVSDMDAIQIEPCGPNAVRRTFVVTLDDAAIERLVEEARAGDAWAFGRSVRPLPPAGLSLHRQPRPPPGGRGGPDAARLRQGPGGPASVRVAGHPVRGLALPAGPERRHRSRPDAPRARRPGRRRPTRPARMRDRTRSRWSARRWTRSAAALAALTDDQRDAIALRFFAGLSAREAAEVMGKQEGTVRGLQFRAIAALRRQLGIDDHGREQRRRAPAPAGGRIR